MNEVNIMRTILAIGGMGVPEEAEYIVRLIMLGMAVERKEPEVLSSFIELGENIESIGCDIPVMFDAADEIVETWQGVEENANKVYTDEFVNLVLSAAKGDEAAREKLASMAKNNIEKVLMDE